MRKKSTKKWKKTPPFTPISVRDLQIFEKFVSFRKKATKRLRADAQVLYFFHIDFGGG